MKMHCCLIVSLFLMPFLALGTDSSPLNSTSISGSANSTDLEPFIVGGVEAQKNEFPWLVHLSIKTKDGTALCSGALIKLDQVLTAAHCVKGASASNIQVTAGDHNRLVNENTEQVLKGKRVIVHRGYDSNDYGELNDIALVNLTKAFTRTNYVSVISLPSYNTTTSTGIVAGWGHTSYGGSISDVVRKVTIPIVTSSSSNCTGQVRDKSTQFCAGSDGKDSCQGDSGGPLMCRNSTSGPYEVCGIVSFGYKCAVKNRPGVYTKVSMYKYWIQTAGSSGIISAKLILLCSFLINFVLSC